MIADDLTGACDSAVAFAAEGFATRVVLALDAEAVTDAALTVVSTDSRDLPPDEAAERVTAACRWMREHDVTVLFKKIDSVLRGNIETEVAAVMCTCGFDSAVLTPAFPAMGRTVSQRELRIFGKKSDNGPHLETIFLSRPEITIEDAETDEDLTATAESALARNPVPLIVGSGGLAVAVAKVLAGRRDRARSPDRLSAGPPRSALPTWFVIGSQHVATEAQIKSIEARGLLGDGGGFVLLRVPLAHFHEQAVRSAVEAVEHGMVGALVVSGGDTADLLCGALRATAIRMGGEILPGIPWGRLEGGPANGTTIVTKSGGFGAPDALLRVADSIKGKDEE